MFVIQPREPKIKKDEELIGKQTDFHEYTHISIKQLQFNNKVVIIQLCMPGSQN